MKMNQARAHYSRILFHIRQLQRALSEAHDAKFIEYKDFQLESPCKSLYELETRFEATTKDAIAKAFDQEMNEEYWKKTDRRRRKK